MVPAVGAKLLDNSDEHLSFRGIYPMQYAFFDAAGELDLGAMRRQLQGCIDAGVDGIAILGLGTEVNKLTSAERLQIVEATAEVTRGRLPLSVTVAEPSVPSQIAFCRKAAELGADWIVLQPPPVRGASEEDLVRFFGKVAEAVDLPIGIQNAPEYTGVGLSAAAIAQLAATHANFRVLKGEGPVTRVQEFVEATDGRVAVFNGRGGLELTDNLRAGCAGMVPGAECCDIQKRIYDLAISPVHADKKASEELYREVLPLIVFLMQSLDSLLCYGKRLAALRYGIEAVHLRDPSPVPTEFGLTCLRKLASPLWSELDVDQLR